MFYNYIYNWTHYLENMPKINKKPHFNKLDYKHIEFTKQHRIGVPPPTKKEILIIFPAWNIKQNVAFHCTLFQVKTSNHDYKVQIFSPCRCNSASTPKVCFVFNVISTTIIERHIFVYPTLNYVNILLFITTTTPLYLYFDKCSLSHTHTHT